MQNHLFIGLGGQGVRTLGELRKVMLQRAKDSESLKNQGVRTEFLAIDSSDDIRKNRSTWTDFGIDLALDPKDWLILNSLGADTIGGLALREDIAPWLGDRQRIEGFLSQQNIQGANQKRRFGRLLFAYNASRIRNAVGEKLEKITTGTPYQCAFHIFATLGGGTGSGGLIDLITLIRDKFPESGADAFPIFVYVYVTDSDEKGANVGYFFQNQFSGLRDLNALICGRLRPQILGDDIPASTFKGSEPISQLVITAPRNSANHQISLETQIRIVAESCYERIVAWSSGQMSPNARRSLTGEDILSEFPSEPREHAERSYRFSALGMRRWEVPTEKLTTLLALDLLASAIRQMLFNNWHETNGFSLQLSDNSADHVTSVLPSLLAEIDASRRVALKTDALVAELRTALGQQTIGLSRTTGSNDANLTLQAIEHSLADFYKNRFEQIGVESVMRQRQAEIPEQVKDVIHRLESRLTEFWLDSTNPIPLARIPQIFDELIARLRQEKATDDYVDERRKKIIESRRTEWDKLTSLSARFTGKRGHLITAHGADCSAVHEGDLRIRLAQLEQIFIKDLLGKLSNVKTRFGSAQQILQRLLSSITNERDQVEQELRALHRDVAANKYEFDPVALDAFLNWMRRHSQNQQNAAFRMREEITKIIGSNQPLSALEENVTLIIEDRLRRTAKQQAELIHQEYEVQREGRPILEASVLDILKKRYESDRKAFLEELQEFLEQAAVCLHLRNDTQPIALLGGGVGVPNMPRRLLLIGLPRHAFSKNLQEEFKSAMPAGQGRVLDVFEHDDQGQIRLLTVDYWLAARFATVVKTLNDKYQSTTTDTRNTETTYFCNIDQDGEQGLRPDLFLPDDETMRLRYEAELWLGQQPDIGIVTVDENGVFLIRQDADGRRPELLGQTIEATIASPDHSKMFSLHARLSAALVNSKREEFLKLLKQQRTDIEKQYGLTSTTFRRWDQMLKLLKPLVD